MHIKRFQAATMIEAVRKVKAALGPDALVLSTRTVRSQSGFFGLLGRPMVEVTAAVERAAPETGREPARAEPQAGPDVPAERPARDPSVARLHEEVRTLRGELRSQYDELRRAGERGSVPDPQTAQELAELRAWTAELARGHAPERGGPCEARLAGKLLASGLTPHHAWRLGRAAAASPEASRSERAALHECLRAHFDARLEPPRSDDGVEVEVLVGPTGVGKTTTLAKLAAREAHETGGVALLTTDTHRLGAVEQLQRYARQLSVPFGVAHGPEELAELVAARPARRVLVDTAGRGADAEALTGLQRLCEAAGDAARVRLVLSATADAEQLRFERARYAGLRPSALILTKLDECASWASAASAVLDEDAPPLLWTAVGQRVPEDLRVPDPVDFTDALLARGGGA